MTSEAPERREIITDKLRDDTEPLEECTHAIWERFEDLGIRLAWMYMYVSGNSITSIKTQRSH